MAELAFQDRLQPALLDRLCDDLRSIPVTEVRVLSARLQEHRISVDAIELAVRPYGLRPWRPDREARGAPSGDLTVLLFSGPVDNATSARVRAAPVATGGEPLTLSQFGEVIVRTVINRALEPAEQRVVSMRKLRESVLRDLSWLLSTTSYDTGASLSAWPEVERSVINFGLPSVAGLGSGSVDPAEAARRLQTAIENFESRLTRVRVTPEFDVMSMDMNALKFRVEAELWGQPTPQHLLLRTQIDVESADVTVTEADSRS